MEDIHTCESWRQETRRLGSMHKEKRIKEPRPASEEWPCAPRWSTEQTPEEEAIRTEENSHDLAPRKSLGTWVGTAVVRAGRGDAVQGGKATGAASSLQNVNLERKGKLDDG